MVLKNGYVQLGQCVTAVEVEFLDTVHTFIHTIYFFYYYCYALILSHLCIISQFLLFHNNTLQFIPSAVFM